MTEASFVDRYGPWALVMGASEGIGAVFARAVAERGLDVVLAARRQGALDEVAREIRASPGADARTTAVDLTELDAFDRIVEATRDLAAPMVSRGRGGIVRWIDSTARSPERPRQRRWWRKRSPT